MSTTTQKPSGVLIEQAGELLKNPLVVPLVRHYPISRLESFFHGNTNMHDAVRWPADLFPMLKAMSQLRSQNAKAWEGHVQSALSPADIVYEFGEAYPAFPGLRFAATMKFGPHRTDISDWPVLLRDVTFVHNGERRNSFNVKPDSFLQPAISSGWQSLPRYTLRATDSYVSYEEDDVRLELHRTPNVMQMLVGGRFVVQTKWVCYREAERSSNEDQPHMLPLALRLHRQVLITEPQTMKKRETGWSEIRITVPAFVDSVLPELNAQVEFRHTLPYGAHDVTLELPYRMFAGQRELYPTRLGKFLAAQTIQGETGRSLHNYVNYREPIPFSWSFKQLEEVMFRIMSSRFPTSEEVAGVSFLQNPPAQLLDLFTQSKK